ncbi:MAG TPA: carbamoyltransferase HypF [Gammaproteobacteria bacterium]|nr:carbamoyltransferase HypF [Gammaproteobacteria bacterium]HDZ78812.1 carbamoyltransferase HypF [Gammaproteobacteria bacterium]
MPEANITDKVQVAYQLCMSGQVQGVGFRPFVYRTATTLGITGWVQNGKGNVIIHAQADEPCINRFIYQLLHQAPAIARPTLEHKNSADLEDLSEFTIRASRSLSKPVIHTPPDYYLCGDCIRELNDPTNRRYRYPFINCTQCGPRYSIIHQLPYDRINTSMSEFVLCPDCQKEYADPHDRRFHAEPVACPVCGPQLTFCSEEKIISDTQQALSKAIDFLHAGKIIAVKGIGGYHLICDARNDEAIQNLRLRKARPHKPFAIMFPAQGDDGLDFVRQYTKLDQVAAQLLTNPARPIVLLETEQRHELSDNIAPGLKQLGIFLPYSPLHYLLLQEFNAPIIASSANISGEPVLTDNDEVEQRLAHIADAFLHHNRRIVRPADDSVYQLINNLPRPIRLGRGVSPLELELPFNIDTPVLAVGGQMKNTIALAWDNRLLVSPHIGELDSPRSMEVFEQAINDLQNLYEIEATIVACDAHPDYRSHRWAKQSGKKIVPVFHHHAHASALVLENIQAEVTQKPWLVFTWDGTGYGEGGSLWGGEALFGQPGAWQRVASFKPFYLPGGDRAGREPWRSAAALCWQAGINYRATQQVALFKSAWDKRINCPSSTSVGRLFDAASSLTGLLDKTSFEGQGAIYLEAQLDSRTDALSEAEPLAMHLNEKNILEADWSSLLPILRNKDLSVAQRSQYFHSTLAATLLKKSALLRECYGDFYIGLTGGVFQNKHLTEYIIKMMQQQGFVVHLNKQLPCNDAGLSAGQIMEVASRLARTD